MTEAWQLSATQLAAAIRARRLSATEAVEQYLERIADLNGEINAIVTLDAQSARRQAGLADAVLARGDASGPLHGVPVTVKDSLATARLRTTSGYPPLADHVPSRDATAVARLRAAGAIVLGKTNLPVLAGDAQAANPIFGRTNNPWDLSRTPGGSTGGGAAALAARMSALELGSDIAGSLRVPAHYCGVCAIKPTDQSVPHTGHIPELPGSPRTARHMGVIGPMARDPADLEVALHAIAGPDGQDFEVPPRPSDPRGEVDPTRFRLAWTDQFGDLVVSQDTRAILARLAELLQRAGWPLAHVTVESVDWVAAWETWGELFQAEVAASMTLDAEEKFLQQWGASDDCAVPILRGMSRAFNATMRQYALTLQRRDSLIAQLDRLFRICDVLICPVAVGPAFPHCASNAPILVDEHAVPYMSATIGYTCPFNLSGHPAVVIPAGWSGDGMPIGVQIVGRRWEDFLLLTLAKAIFDLVLASPGRMADASRQRGQVAER